MNKFSLSLKQTYLLIVGVFAAILFMITATPSFAHLKLNDYEGIQYMIIDESDYGTRQEKLQRDYTPHEEAATEEWKPRKGKMDKFTPGFVYWQEKECWINIHTFPAIEKQEKALVLYHPATRLGIVINFRNAAECNAALNILRKGHDIPLPPYHITGVDSDQNQGRCQQAPSDVENLPRDREGNVVPTPQYFDESVGVVY